MFDNIGYKIKTLAQTISVIGIICSVIYGVSLLSNDMIGIGFIVIIDIITKRFKFKKFRLHTKIVLVYTLFFIVFAIINIDITISNLRTPAQTHLIPFAMLTRALMVLSLISMLFTLSNLLISSFTCSLLLKSVNVTTYDTLNGFFSMV